MAAPTSTTERIPEAEPAEGVDLPAPMSLVPIVLGILVAVVAVWALSWLAWMP